MEGGNSVETEMAVDSIGFALFRNNRVDGQE